MKKRLLSTCLAIVAGICITNAQTNGLVNITNSGTEAENAAWTYQTFSGGTGIKDLSSGRTDNASYAAHSTAATQPFLASPRISANGTTATPTFHVSFWIRDTIDGGGVVTWNAPLDVMVVSDNGTINSVYSSNFISSPWSNFGSQLTTVSNSTFGLYDSTTNQWLPSNFQLTPGWHHITADITPLTLGNDYYIGFSDGTAPAGDQLQWDDFNISSTDTGLEITPFTLQSTCTDENISSPTTINGVTVTRSLSGGATNGQGVSVVGTDCAPSTGQAFDGAASLPGTASITDMPASVTYNFNAPVNNIVVKFYGTDSAADQGDSLIFTTNAGTATVSGSICGLVQPSANTLTSVGAGSDPFLPQPANAPVGGGVVTVSSIIPYTSLTVTKKALNQTDHVYVVLCGNSVAPAATPQSECDYNTVTTGDNVTYNGVTVTRSFSGNTAVTTPSSETILPDDCGTELLDSFAANLPWLIPYPGNGQNNGAVTFNFSQPVNDIVVTTAASNSEEPGLPEAVTFSTDSGIVTASANYSCHMTQFGNTWTATNTTTHGGGLIVTVHSTTPYTSLTVTDTGSASQLGTVVGLCSNSISGTLPVGYGQQLNAILDGPAVNLSWSTATEINDKGFSIQRSADGKTFSNIGFVASKAVDGNSTKTLSYTYTDVSPVAGVVNYYRLLQTDQDGDTSYSRVVSADPSGVHGGISLYPNPAHGSITISGLQAGSNVIIYNATGVELKHFAAASAVQQVNIIGWPAGIYFVKVLSGANESTAKFIVR